MVIQGMVQHINPTSLHKNPAYTNVIVVSGSVKTVYVGGQDSVDSSGTIVGKGDFRAQAEQVLNNVQAGLLAAGADLRHVVKWNIFILQGQDLRIGLEAFQRAWGDRSNPPAITGIFVSGLAHPDFLLEMDAIAVVPDQKQAV
jgi:adhesin HecA-like repeat protein